jgi:hypothetical protein
VGDNDRNSNVFLCSTGGNVSGNICGSDDWLVTLPNDRERVAVDLKFNVNSYTANDDLTLKLMRDNCGPTATPVPVANGAPMDGGLRIDYNTPDGGSADCFYVVVAAKYEGGGNTYQLNCVSAP